MRLLWLVGGLLIGAVLFGVVAFVGGFLIAQIVPSSGTALGMLVPMLVVPVAALIGALVGAWRGWVMGAAANK